MPERNCWSSLWREFLIANLSRSRVGDGNRGALFTTLKRCSLLGSPLLLKHFL